MKTSPHNLTRPNNLLVYPGFRNDVPLKVPSKVSMHVQSLVCSHLTLNSLGSFLPDFPKTRKHSLPSCLPRLPRHPPSNMSCPTTTRGCVIFEYLTQTASRCKLVGPCVRPGIKRECQPCVGSVRSLASAYFTSGDCEEPAAQ